MREVLASAGLACCALAAGLASAGPTWLHAGLFALAAAFTVRTLWLLRRT